MVWGVYTQEPMRILMRADRVLLEGLLPYFCLPVCSFDLTFLNSAFARLKLPVHEQKMAEQPWIVPRGSGTRALTLGRFLTKTAGLSSRQSKKVWSESAHECSPRNPGLRTLVSDSSTVRDDPLT